MSSTLDRYPRRDGVYSILPDSVIVHDRYRNRVVRLDPLCTEIWLRMDGLTTLRDIATDIAVQRDAPITEIERSTAAMVGIMNMEGLLYVEFEPNPLPYHLTMPLDDQDPLRAAESMRAAGWI